MRSLLGCQQAPAPLPCKSGVSAESHLRCGNSVAQYLRFAYRSHSGAAQDKLGFGVSCRFWFSFGSYCSCLRGSERSGPVGSEHHVPVDYVRSRMQVCGGEQVVCGAAVLSAHAPWVIALMSAAFWSFLTPVPDMHAGSPTFILLGRRCRRSHW